MSAEQSVYSNWKLAVVISVGTLLCNVIFLFAISREGAGALDLLFFPILSGLLFLLFAVTAWIGFLISIWTGLRGSPWAIGATLLLTAVGAPLVVCSLYIALFFYAQD